jgi:hypothetical protein
VQWMYVCMHACILMDYACMYACDACVWVDGWKHACMRVSMYVVDGRMSALCMSTCVHACVYNPLCTR